MQILREEWLHLLAEIKSQLTIDEHPATIIWDDIIIMDNILLLSNHIPTLLYYFSYLSQAFTKFRTPFELSKYDFFKPQMECVGRNLTVLGNYLNKSNFKLVTEWPLLTTCTSFLSFIGICLFYNRYYSWLETNI